VVVVVLGDVGVRPFSCGLLGVVDVETAKSLLCAGCTADEAGTGVVGVVSMGVLATELESEAAKPSLKPRFLTVLELRVLLLSM
jgi:hypothetical protein